MTSDTKLLTHKREPFPKLRAIAAVTGQTLYYGVTEGEILVGYLYLGEPTREIEGFWQTVTGSEPVYSACLFKDVDALFASSRSMWSVTQDYTKIPEPSPYTMAVDTRYIYGTTGAK